MTASIQNSSAVCQTARLRTSRRIAGSTKEVETLYNIGIVDGTDEHKFSPDAPVTRAEFAVMAARFANLDYEGAATSLRMFLLDTGRIAILTRRPMQDG